MVLHERCKLGNQNWQLCVWIGIPHAGGSLFPALNEGECEFRFTPSPVHSDAQIADLIAALEELWAACPVGKGKYVRLAAA